MIKDGTGFIDNTIIELKITLGFREIIISGDKVGLFIVRGLNKCMSKISTVKSCYIADELLLEIHRDAVAEIEMLLKNLNIQQGEVIDSISVECADSLGEEKYYVYDAYKKYRYHRVTSMGDLRIMLGSSDNWPMVDTFEVSPPYFFDYDNRGIGIYATVPEVQARNYKDAVYKRMRKTASIIKAMQKASGIEAKGEFYTHPRLVLYLSIFDKFIQYKYGEHLCLSPYTYYDECDNQWRNIRVDNLFIWYPKVDDTKAVYKEEMQYICLLLQTSTIQQLAIILFELSTSDNEEEETFVWSKLCIQ